MTRTILIAAMMLFVNLNSAYAAPKKAVVVGSRTTVRFERSAKKLLLHVNDAAKAFGWEAKVVKPGSLVTICRGGENGICIPVRLKKVKWAKRKTGLFVESAPLSKILKFQVEERRGRVALRPIKRRNANKVSDNSSYNAAWGPGRGFKVGQTVPDIPLYDFDGEEVRFSKLLGKQYILYAWASW
jgi:hypothetical protein